tara:strand:- start:1957 stop:2574 length:618 start_codon:yes stop_codon:yes gene_type:complete
MKILLAPLLLAVSLPAFAEVDTKIHKLCIEAKDYAGCVRAMKGETMPTSRVINSQGADIAEGNQCPSGFAYVGGGNCMEVKCLYSPSGLGYDQGHDQRVAGKANWKCKYSFWQGAGVMQLVGSARASLNPSCPPGEPAIGYNSTCQMALKKSFQPSSGTNSGTMNNGINPSANYNAGEYKKDSVKKTKKPGYCNGMRGHDDARCW